MESKYIFPIARNKLHIAYLPSAIVVAGITWLSLARITPMPVEDIPLLDKWEHAFAYMVLALCLAGDSYRARVSTRVIYMVSIVLPVVYGGLIELIQPYFPPRTCELGDWLADCIGATIGILIFGIFHICVIRRKQTRQASDKQ
jgi:VanZ family protein